MPGNTSRKPDHQPTLNHPVALKDALVDAFEIARREKGITRREVAQRIGVTPATVSAMLNPDAGITLNTACRLFDAIDKTLEITVK